MGIYDRDYYRNTSRGGFGQFQAWSVTTWLIVINIAVFALEYLTSQSRGMDPLTSYGYFSLATSIFGLQVWRFITYQFLHSGLWHIFGNMLGLYLFGPIVETQFGSRRFLGFYLSCGIAGAVSYIILWSTGVLNMSADSPMIGASAAIFGVLVAAAMIAPGVTIQLWFPPIPLTIRTLAWIAIGIAVWQVMNQGVNAGGEAAHLGGAAWGYLLMKNQHWLNILTPRRRGMPARQLCKRVAFKDWSRDMNH